MVVVLLLIAGMLSAIVFLAAESKPKSEAAQAANAKGNKPAPTPGNIAAGKAVFASAGCASCHTYTLAGSSGTVGPNLDDLAANARRRTVALSRSTRPSRSRIPTRMSYPGSRQA